MQIKKALITAGGVGTRFFPETKVVQKEMIPILEYPTLDYVVKDCVNAGIKEIVIVVNEMNDQVKRYFTEDKKLYEYLKRFNKLDKYEPLKELHTQADFSFVIQKISDPYGTAVPFINARDHFKNEEAFIAFTGDDLIVTNGDRSHAGSLIENMKDDYSAIVTCVEKEEKELHKYGVMEVEETDGIKLLRGGVEKPETGTAPSNLINISKYLFSAQIYDAIDKLKADSKTGELFIYDAVLDLCKNSKVAVQTLDGTYLDCGAPVSWLKANIYMASRDPEVKKEIEEFMKSL